MMKSTMSLDFELHVYDQSSNTEISVLDMNITNNLNTMAAAAGIYEALWRPDECGIENAAMLVPILCAGIRRLEKNPDVYKTYEHENGWGRYENLLEFARRVRDASIVHPDARIEISR